MSQSLQYQGLHQIELLERAFLLCEVSIPSISGITSDTSIGAKHPRTYGLNPFNIRDYIRSIEAKLKEKNTCLNPFNIRDYIRSKAKPFWYIAFVSIPSISGITSDLLPAHQRYESWVSIPSISGITSDSVTPWQLATCWVSIPSISGITSDLNRPTSSKTPSSLNPFNIRDYIRLHAAQLAQRAIRSQSLQYQGLHQINYKKLLVELGAVSIPSISGITSDLIKLDGKMS